MKFFSLLPLCALAASFSSAETPPPDALGLETPERQYAFEVQLFLDENGFGPGRIDARWGEFTRKAADRWNQSNPENRISLPTTENPAPPSPWSKQTTTKYTITNDDAARISPVPENPEAQAQKKALNYESLLELVAEKFHAYPQFVLELNPRHTEGDLMVGTTLVVPNVSNPFDVSAAEAASPNSESSAELLVDTAAKFVEIRENGRILHAFPITPGAEGNAAPHGEWKVESVAFMPDFRWDKKMLEQGERSDEAFILPPGPNNPVGVVWIGINSDGIGLHGTSNPDDIGRNASHGCIRLSNWDAFTLAGKISVGTKVTIQ